MMPKLFSLTICRIMASRLTPTGYLPGQAVARGLAGPALEQGLHEHDPRELEDRQRDAQERRRDQGELDDRLATVADDGLGRGADVSVGGSE